MKRTMGILVLCLLLLPGCGGVWMNAEYSQLLDATAALSDESATRAEKGLLTPTDSAQILRLESNVFQKLRAAKGGVKSPTTAPVGGK